MDTVGATGTDRDRLVGGRVANFDATPHRGSARLRARLLALDDREDGEKRVLMDKLLRHKDCHGRTVLHLAASLTDSEAAAVITRWLLTGAASGAAVRQALCGRDAESGWTPAHRAAYQGNWRAFLTMLRRDRSALTWLDAESLSPLDLYCEAYLPFRETVGDRASFATSSPTPRREVWVWGANYDFQLGVPNPTHLGDAPQTEFQRLQLPGPEAPWPHDCHPAPCMPIVQVATASQHSLFLTVDGQVLAAGLGANGRLGLGVPPAASSHPTDAPAARHTASAARPYSCMHPTRIPELEWPDDRVLQVAAGGNRSGALTCRGLVYHWGGDVWQPRLVHSLRKEAVAHLSLGAAHSLAVARAGRLYAAVASAPDAFRQVVAGVIGERPVVSAAAGDDLLCVALVRDEATDDVFVWTLGSPTVRRVALPPLLTIAPATNRAWQRSPRQVQRLAEVAVGEQLVVMRTPDQRGYVLDLAGEAVAKGRAHSRHVNADPLSLPGMHRAGVMSVTCGGRCVYVVDRHGCAWRWSGDASRTKAGHRWHRVHGLRGVESMVATGTHAVAVVAERPIRVPAHREDVGETFRRPLPLSQLCERSLLPCVCLDTALELLEHAAMLGADTLAETCAAFLQANLDILVATQHRRSIPLERYPRAITRMERYLEARTWRRCPWAACLSSDAQMGGGGGGAGQEVERLLRRIEAAVVVNSPRHLLFGKTRNHRPMAESMPPVREDAEEARRETAEEAPAASSTVAGPWGRMGAAECRRAAETPDLRQIMREEEEKQRRVQMAAARWRRTPPPPPPPSTRADGGSRRLASLPMPVAVRRSAPLLTPPAAAHTAASSPTGSTTSPGSFRELLFQEAALAGSHAFGSAVTPPHAWRRSDTARSATTAAASVKSIAQIESEERQHQAELEEALWLTEQIHRIEQAERQCTPATGHRRARTRAPRPRHAVRAHHSHT
ncbi:hypothetical protein CDCA_CDCA01G0402 [Cyanidium caldarium]|uniref:Uncharacterized protein n=1 Tax=Cyanidium caldarium TaxID=2771 RepID=A0AAV9IQ38_CYACA|nr:hypothetical protein CDCA_CDCA01G0402 [Cyanidium caldarium]